MKGYSGGDLLTTLRNEANVDLTRFRELLLKLELDVQEASATYVCTRRTPDGRTVTIEVIVTDDGSDAVPFTLTATRKDDYRISLVSEASATAADALASIGGWNELDRVSEPRRFRAICLDDD